jgi:hypothetical protein
MATTGSIHPSSRSPAPNYPGNSAPNIITGPGMNNWDIGAGKLIASHELIALQFRADAFNAFNHVSIYVRDLASADRCRCPDDNVPSRTSSLSVNRCGRGTVRAFRRSVRIRRNPIRSMM